MHPEHRALGLLSRAPTVGVRYPVDRAHSPIGEAVARNLRAIVARGEHVDDNFAKVGASATASRNFLHCFDGPGVELAGRDHLEETISFFGGGAQNSFRRESRVATPGWHAGRAVFGRPSPLTRELRESDPRFAVVMYGTNDIEIARPYQYAQIMTRLARSLIRRGVVPIMSSVMPRDDDPEADQLVPLYNAVIRGVAQRFSVPFIDYHRELARLPDHGLASDDLHPNVRFVDGHPRGCDFSDQGLRFGYNIRNLLTIQALDRVRRVTLDGAPPPDQAAAVPVARGSIGDPIPMQLPFAHAGDTARSPHRLLSRYPDCDPAPDESGPEYTYHLHLDEPAEVHVMVVAADPVDVDLHRLTIGARGARCVARDDRELVEHLPAGDHYFVVDTFVDTEGVVHAGEFMIVAARTDQPSDPS